MSKFTLLLLIIGLLASDIQPSAADQPPPGYASDWQPWFVEAREPDGDALKARMEELKSAVYSGDTVKSARVTRAFYPSAQRVRTALRNEPSQELLDFYQSMEPKTDLEWSQLFKISKTRSQITVYGATTEEMKARTELVRQEFPGGAVRMASTHFKPGVRFYEVEFTKPGQSIGMKYHLFFWDGSDWCMLGPIWRAAKGAR